MAKKIKFKPYGAWILLPDPTSNKTESGIIVDDKTARKLSTNVLEALAVGPNCVSTKVGDILMVDPTSEARIITIDEKTYLLVLEHQILGQM